MVYQVHCTNSVRVCVPNVNKIGQSFTRIRILHFTTWSSLRIVQSMYTQGEYMHLILCHMVKDMSIHVF